MMFKCVNKLVPDYLIGKFTLGSQVHTRNTRQCGQLNIPRCRRTTGQRSFTYRGARLWNHLRDDVNRTYNLRNSDFSLPRYNTVTYGKHSIGFLGPSLWAKLTNKERNIETLSSFKNMIRKKDISAVVEGCGRDCYLYLS